MTDFKAEFRQIFLIFFCGLVSVFCVANQVSATDKNILISPSRIVFEGKTRSAVVKLINPNDKPKTYEISISAMRMDESGKKDYVDSPNDEDRLAIDMIRYSPRRVTIGPKVWQTVRLMVKKPKDLPPGEYRTQLRVKPVLEKKKPDEETNTKNISVNIMYAFSISIPIIVRNGEGNVALAAGRPELVKENDRDYLETRIDRTGLHSAYFDIRAFFTPSGKTERMEIGTRKGLTIYSKNDYQMVRIPIENKDRITQGKIGIELRDQEKEGKPVIYSNSFDINGLTASNEYGH